MSFSFSLIHEAISVLVFLTWRFRTGEGGLTFDFFISVFSLIVATVMN